MEIVYGSLIESAYCRFLAKELKYIDEEDFKKAFSLKDEIGAMLYSTIDGQKRKNNKKIK